MVLLGVGAWLRSRDPGVPVGSDEVSVPGATAEGDERTRPEGATRAPSTSAIVAPAGLGDEVEVVPPDPCPEEPIPVEDWSGLGTLVVALRTSGGKPVAEALLRLEPDSDWLPSPGAVRHLWTDARGEATFPFLSGGGYRVGPGRNKSDGGFGWRPDLVAETGWFIPKRKQGRGWPRPGITRVRVRNGETVRRVIEVAFASSVTGVVVDAENKPVYDATLGTSFRNQGDYRGSSGVASTDRQGRFTISGLSVPEEGDLAVIISPPGHQSWTAGERKIELHLDLVPGEVVDLGTIRLDQILGVARGRLVGTDGKPIPDAELTLAEESQAKEGGYRQSAWTEEDGRFVFGGVTEGSHVLTSEDHLLLPDGNVWIDFQPGTRELDIGDVIADMQAWTLKATFFLGDGSPAAGAVVWVGDEDLVADAAGRVSPRMEGRGLIGLSWKPAGAGDGLVTDEWFSPPPAGQNVLEIVFRARGLVLELRDRHTGELLDPHLVVVKVASLGGQRITVPHLDSPGPRIRLHVPAGVHDLTVMADGYSSAKLRVTASEHVATSHEETVIVGMARSR